MLETEDAGGKQRNWKIFTRPFSSKMTNKALMLVPQKNGIKIRSSFLRPSMEKTSAKLSFLLSQAVRFPETYAVVLICAVSFQHKTETFDYFSL